MAAGGKKKPQGGTGSVPPSPRDPGARATAKAAKAAGASRESTEQIASVKRKAPEVAEVVKKGQGTVADARRTAKLPDAERAEVVAKVTSGEAPTLKEALASMPVDAVRKDALGRVLPPEIADAFEAKAAIYATAINRVAQLVGDLGKIPELTRLRGDVQTMGAEIRRSAPCTACVYCKLLPDRLADCLHCGGSGISTAAKFKAAIPLLQVAGDEAMVLSTASAADGGTQFVRFADVVAGVAQ